MEEENVGKKERTARRQIEGHKVNNESQREAANSGRKREVADSRSKRGKKYKLIDINKRKNGNRRL